MMTYMKRGLKDYKFIFIFFMIVVIFLISIMAPQISPYNPMFQNYDKILEAPSSEYLLGTDYVGRDILSRILYGARTSLFIALVVTFFITIIGTSIGIIAGYNEGFLDNITMRIVEIVMSFPYIVFVIALVSIFGSNLKNLILALSLVSWTNYARVSRSKVLELKNEDFINQAKLGGASNFRIIFHYLIPNIFPYLLVMSSQDIANNLLTLSVLSILGVGLPPPTPEWGYMIMEGKKYMQTAPWLMISPGVAILICVIIFNLFGDCLRDILDPKN